MAAKDDAKNVKIGDVPTGIAVLDAWGWFRMGVPLYASLIGRAVDNLPAAPPQQPFSSQTAQMMAAWTSIVGGQPQVQAASANRQVLPMSSGRIVWPGQGVEIVARTQITFRPERLFVGQPDGWLVDELRIGNRIVFGPDAGLDAHNFATSAFDNYIEMPIARTAEDLRLRARNVDAGGDAAMTIGLRLDGKVRWFQTQNGHLDAPMLDLGLEGREPPSWPAEAITSMPTPTVLSFHSSGDGTPNARVYAVDDATGLLVLDVRAGQPVRFGLAGLSEPGERKRGKRGGSGRRPTRLPDTRR